MRHNERADLSADPTAIAGTDSTTRSDRFVFVPLRFRREHREWSNAEHAAWFDLFLASFEVEGTFDSPEVARAYLGPRAAALDALMARDEFVEQDDGTWILADYLELYDRRRPRHYKTLAERLADADAKQARGEPLEPIERWARWKARQKAKRAETESEREEGSKDKELDRANVEPTLANEPTQLVHRLGNLYEAFTQLTGLPCTKVDEGKIDNLCRNFDRDLVRRAMYADPDPSRNPEKFIGRTYHRLKEGTVAA